MNNHFIQRNKCPACFSRETQEIFKVPFNQSPIKDYLLEFYNPQGGIEFEYLENVSYQLEECKICGLIFQKFIPNDFLMDKLYSQWIDPKFELKNRYQYRTFNYYNYITTEIIHVIRFFHPKTQNLQFLDFGMGWGDWCQVSKAFGIDVHGFEISDKKIQYAKEKGIQSLTINQIEEMKFDFINTEQVFEHIPRPFDSLTILTKTLKPNGIIKISVPNGWNIKRKLKNPNWNAPKGSKRSLNAVAPLEHINCFNYTSLIAMGKRLNITPISIYPPVYNLKDNLDLSLLDLAKNIYEKTIMTYTPKKSCYIFFKKL